MLVCRPSGAFDIVVAYRWLAPPAKLFRPCRGSHAAAPHTTNCSEKKPVAVHWFRLLEMPPFVEHAGSSQLRPARVRPQELVAKADRLLHGGMEIVTTEEIDLDLVDGTNRRIARLVLQQ